MRIIAPIFCILTAAVLGVCLTFERQACAKLAHDNDSLRYQLDQTDKLQAENKRLSTFIAEATSRRSHSNESAALSSADDEPARELARLRTEIEALRQQSKEIETLRADTREIRAATEVAAKAKNANHLASGLPGGSAVGSQFELLQADYWTEKTNMDVAAELRDRIRGDSLKAIANNNLKGDPDFGQVKHLTVVYRLGGATFTNEFREGDYIALPKEPEQ
jgi:predicted RNase H-like nuclease (RuvC/YqgF family)